jgi:UDP-N-acetylglucosamine--dolichyl-phosphate N-acetylglucosaminephosphotransferase
MLILLFSMFVSFLVTFFIAPYFMQFLQAGGVVGIDLHKKLRPRLPTSGGVCVAFGIIAGLLTYIGLTTFLGGPPNEITNLLAVLSSVLITMFVGFLDDLNVKARAVLTKEGLDIRIGFPQWAKPLLTLPAAIPLMVVNAGETMMDLPFLGVVNFGILYPLILIPIGFVGASNAINLLGGFNGSETGMGIVYLLGLGVFAALSGSIGSVIFLVAFAALIGFIKYNWYPAKFLPGDSLTYLLGAIVVSGAIVGNMEKIGVIIMIPFIIEFVFKLRSKLKASCIGKLRKDGRLDPPYGRKIYSLTHLIMNIKPLTEKQVAIILILIECAFAVIPFLHIV